MHAKVFVDHYEVLGLEPGAGAEAIEHRFRLLARRYHPDNQATGDRSRFDSVVEAHKLLRDPAKRAQYHYEHRENLPPWDAPEEAEAVVSSEGVEEAEPPLDALGIDKDLFIQNSILMMMYHRRRRNVREPGMGNTELEELANCPREHLEFHLWYLKAKGWIATGEDGMLAITIDGVDRAAAIYKESAGRMITDQT